MKMPIYTINLIIAHTLFSIILCPIPVVAAKISQNYGGCPDPTKIKIQAGTEGWIYTATTERGVKSLALQGQLPSNLTPENYNDFILAEQKELLVACLYTLKNSNQILYLQAKLPQECQLSPRGADCGNINTCYVECLRPH